MNNTHQVYTTGSVTSQDGTVIGYRRLGSGPGIILLHAAVNAAQHLMKLGSTLSDMFTVYIPDRRGRGLSGSFGENYGMQKEVEDLDALLQKSEAHYVFGHSAGALISLCATLALPSIRKAALYEPPLDVNNSILVSSSFMTRFDREIAEGKIAEAMATFLKGFVRDVEPGQAKIGILPRFILVPMLARFLRDDAEKVKGDDVPFQELLPTFHFDNLLVVETKGTVENFKTVRAEVLLLEGSTSPPSVKQALDALGKVLPNVERVELPGLGHSAPVDTDDQERVAQELRRFFL